MKTQLPNGNVVIQSSNQFGRLGRGGRSFNLWIPNFIYVGLTPDTSLIGTVFVLKDGSEPEYVYGIFGFTEAIAYYRSIKEDPIFPPYVQPWGGRMFNQSVRPVLLNKIT